MLPALLVPGGGGLGVAMRTRISDIRWSQVIVMAVPDVDLALPPDNQLRCPTVAQHVSVCTGNGGACSYLVSLLAVCIFHRLGARDSLTYWPR